MSILKKILEYKKVCIQCHNNPDADAIASAYAVYCYLQAHGAESNIVYGGEQKIDKTSLKMLIKECDIPIKHTHSISDFDLLLLIDCQYGQNNVEQFSAENIMIIDHHIQVVDSNSNYLINSSYQSCSTLIYELLLEEGFPVKDNKNLTVALLFGLYTDTSSFTDLFENADMIMKKELYTQQPLFEKLIKSNMSIAELLVISDAIYNHYFDVEYRFAIVEALKCEQAVLGMIGDFIIQVDVIAVSFTYAEIGNGYQISVRSCHENLEADKIATYVCEEIGGGGGHKKKGGGRIIKTKMEEKYVGMEIFDVVNLRLCQYIEQNRKK